MYDKIIKIMRVVVLSLVCFVYFVEVGISCSEPARKAFMRITGYAAGTSGSIVDIMPLAILRGR